jgi:hypothetical protein
VDALKKTFQPYDEPVEALNDIKKLCLGDNSITEHNSRFRLLVSQTGMTDSPMLIDLYQEMLPWALQSLIIRSEHPSKSGTPKPQIFILDTKGRNAFLRDKMTN